MIIMKKKTLKKILLPIFFLILLSLSGCALEFIEGLGAADFAAVGTESVLMEEAGLTTDLATGRILVSNEGAFLSELERVKIGEPLFEGGNNRLYIEQNGIKKYFGEVVDDKTINISKINKTIRIPNDMEIYRVSGNNVNVRSSPEINIYNVYKKLNTNDIILVKPYNKNWFIIQINKNATGFIAASVITATATTHKVNNTYVTHGSTRSTCTSCNGSGHIGIGIKCTTCGGDGYLRCATCGANGFLHCNTCGGNGFLRCSTCGANGFLRCGTCGGSGTLRDYRGNSVTCISCQGQGQLKCITCQGQGQLRCITCQGQGQLKCLTCQGQGQLKCITCQGSGQLMTYQTCPQCNGSGYIVSNY